MGYLALNVHPFVAALAQNPLLPIRVRIVIRLHVDLSAEIAVLVVLVGVGTDFAEPKELALAELAAGPTVVLVAEAFEPAKPVSASSQSPLGNYLFI